MSMMKTERASVVRSGTFCPPVGARLEVLQVKVGQGVLFDEPGIHPGIYQLRRQMAAEIKQLGEPSQ
jgi:hypothetical protein